MVNIYASPWACLQVWVPVFTQLHWDQADFQALRPPFLPSLCLEIGGCLQGSTQRVTFTTTNDRDSWEKSNEMGLLPAPPRKLVIRSWRAFHQEPKENSTNLLFYFEQRMGFESRRQIKGLPFVSAPPSPSSVSSLAWGGTWPLFWLSPLPPGFQLPPLNWGSQHHCLTVLERSV